MFNSEVSAINFISIKSFDGSVSFNGIKKFNVSKTSALAVIVRESDFRWNNVEFFQVFRERFEGGLKAEISNEEDFLFTIFGLLGSRSLV